MEYLFILLFILFTTLVAHWLSGVKIYRNIKEAVIFISFLAIVGVTWDKIAIHRGHWIFPEENIIGIKIGIMPIEEYLFILIVPYFILTFYKIFTEKLNFK